MNEWIEYEISLIIIIIDFNFSHLQRYLDIEYFDPHDNNLRQSINIIHQTAPSLS